MIPSPLFKELPTSCRLVRPAVLMNEVYVSYSYDAIRYVYKICNVYVLSLFICVFIFNMSVVDIFMVLK